MDSLNVDVVRETTIFTAISPRSLERHQRPPGSTTVRSSPATDADFRACSLPMVLSQDTSRPSSQLASHLLSPKTPQSLLMSAPMTTGECWQVWKFLCDWVKTQIAMEVPAAIPGFGTFFVRVQPLGIRMTLFQPDKQFLGRFGLKVDVDVVDSTLNASFPATVLDPGLPEVPPSPTTGGYMQDEQNIGELFAFSFLEMASCCRNSVDATKAKEWLAVVIQKLGHAMNRCGRVELNIGVGVIVCVDGVIQRRLSPRDSYSSPKLQYEIRTGESVVKRNLRAQAALQAPLARKTKYSFLSGSDFSSSIQLNPVIDRSKDVPDFSFRPPTNPRPPVSTPLSVVVGSRSSPRSTQLQKRHQRSASPLVNRINIPLMVSDAMADEQSVKSSVSMIQQQNEEHWISPELFDRLSRTLCVEPDQNLSCLVPSNRIGSNFTATAAFLMSDKYASQFGWSAQNAGGLIVVERPAAPNPTSGSTHKPVVAESTSERRYFEYLSDAKLIDQCYLAPLSLDVEKRVVSSAVKCAIDSSGAHIEKVMEAAHQEFVEIYYTSTKKAILNYLLMRKASRERIGIPYGVPNHALLPEKWKWGTSDGPNGCTSDLKALVVKQPNVLAVSSISKPAKRCNPSQPTGIIQADYISRLGARHGKVIRRKRVQSKLMSLLVLSNTQVRLLRYMWHDLLTSVTLVDLPTAKGLNDDLEPMDILEFEKVQLAYSAKLKAFVMERWYTTTKLMFESAIRAETFSIHTSERAVNFRLRHLFDTVAAVMSLQIRSLIMKSVQAYVNFFELFGGMKEANNDSEFSLQLRDRSLCSGLLTTLMLQDGQIQFRDPLVDIPSRLLNVLHNIPKLFCNLGRIETQFEEPLLLPNTSSPFLWNVVSQEDDIVVATIRIRAIIEENLSYLRKLQTDYETFALTHRYVNSVDCFNLEERNELESYRAEMERVQATVMQLAIDNRHSQQLGLFSVDCRYVNSKLHTELAQWTIRLLEAFEQRTGRMNSELRQQYKEIAARLAKKPLDLYELVDSEAFVQTLKTAKLKELQDKGSIIKQRLRFLLFERENMHVGNITVQVDGDPTTSDQELEREISSVASKGFRLSIELLSSTAKTVKWRSHIEKLLKDAEALLVNERARIEVMFIAKRSRFQAELEEFEGEVKGFAKKGDLRHAATYVVQLAKMKDNMFIFRQAMDTISKEEQKLQWKPTDFGKLDDIAEEMAPYEQLWKTVREFREMNSRWLRGNVFEIPGKDGLQTLQQMLTIVANVSSVLLLNSATAETVRKQMTDFRENVRLIVAIQNPAMKERHMKEVSGLIGLDFSSDEPITLLKLLENGAFELVGDVVDISSNATQEQHIERALNEMDEEWEAKCFQFIPARHPFSSTGVLSAFITPNDADNENWDVVLDKPCAENILAIVEDHLLRLQTLSYMSHAGPFVEQIALWLTFASEMGQMIDMLKTNEDLWRKMTPLFAAGTVEVESKEANLFASAAQLYRSVHVSLLQSSACKELFQRANVSESQGVASFSPAAALISDLEQCRLLFETVKGEIQVGLEAKRLSFARFYFLSDAELVTALSLTKVPSDAKLWRSLTRCFPGICSVQTNAANDITAFVSSAGEPFPLGSPIVTTDTIMPEWLTKLETSMTTILHASIRAASNDLSRKEFRKWCLIWPEQSLLAALQHIWTLESEQANRDPNPRRAWSELANTLQDNIDAVSKEIRVAAYPHAKVTLANVILLLNQLCDVSKTVLGEIGGVWVDEHTESVSDTSQKEQQASACLPSLAWIAQPRFYFIDSVLSVSVLTSSQLTYGLEYLGNGQPGILVTPLTLRCYHAIGQTASTMAKGACLEGEAGIGKSTICYQFARLCGRLFVAFQCGSRRLSFDDLVNFVKATASSGAWLCIDNLHLMDVTSIPMVTTLCAHVMTSLAAREAQCTLVGEKVRLRRGGLFLLTLTSHLRLQPNASRHSKPHKLIPYHDARHFFRAITVQAPDMETLAAFAFQCSKFVHASVLAKIVVVVLTAFERGFELMNNPMETSKTSEFFTPRLVSLHQTNHIVRRATELNNLEKEHSRSNRKGSFFSSDAEENDEVSPTGEIHGNDSTAEAIAKSDEERMEHRNVCLALREYLGSMIPSANIHLIDAVLRDCSAQTSARDLRVSNSMRWMTRGSSMLKTNRMGAKRSLEDDVENYVRINESAWKRFGVEFGLKAIQLLQTMRNHRLVVLSGGVQTGKTSLYEALSRAMTHISRERFEERLNNIRALNSNNGERVADAAILRPTRCVVVFPRALRPGQLFDLAAEDHSHTLFSKLLFEAKQCYKADKCTQTWLVFDGDLDISWSEQLIYTVEELQDNFVGSQKGMQLSSGKKLCIPSFVRIVIESTSLENATPSFITRVGTVHVNGESGTTGMQGWEHFYRVWKALRKTDFDGFAETIFTTLDSLMTETVPCLLTFVSTNFQEYNIYHQQGVPRVQWMLALFHSSLIQSWKKFTALTSEKQRNTAVHCLFLQALVWGVGNTTNTLERQKFHLFLYDLILRGSKSDQSNLKRLVTLLFPNGTTTRSNPAGDKASTCVQAGSSAPGHQTIYDYGFSVEFGSKWLPWTEYYNRWVRQRLGSAPVELVTSQKGPAGSGSTVGSIGAHLSRLYVPTGTTAATICLTGQLLLANYPAAIIGPRDSGKTVCGSAWMLLGAAVSHVQPDASSTAPSLPESTDTECSNLADPSSEENSFIRKMHVGFYTRARDVLLHFESILQRIRVEHQGRLKGEPALAHPGQGNGNVPSSTPVAHDFKRTIYVFVDDLHCLNTSRKMDSAVELVRMLAEQKTLVDPSTNNLTPCPNLLPLVTLQVPTPRAESSPSQLHGLIRLVRKFIPIALQPFSDSDLCSICENFPSSMTLSTERPTSPMDSGTAQTPVSNSSATSAAFSVSKEAEQLQSVIIKASLKLYRLLTSSSDFTILKREETFNSFKVHYNHRTDQLFQIVKNICCDVRPPMSLAEKPALARLWCHESARVFGDSLMENNECVAFHRRVLDIALPSFGVTDDAFFPARLESAGLQNQAVTLNWLENQLLFSFVAETGSGGVYRNGYHEVTEMPKLEVAVERSMIAMCRGGPGVSNSAESLEIVLCSYVIKHVLRVSRLLRMGRKAMLFLGARGRKVVTITRLACYMCKKASMIYRMPVQSLPEYSETENMDSCDDTSKWNATLRAVMLRSVRLRDTSLVFIVKDVKLDPEAFPHRIIDQLLGGHDVPSNIVAHEDLNEEILAILRDGAEQERNSALRTASDGDHPGARPHTPFLFRSKSAILEYFFRCVRQKLQIVLVLSPPLIDPEDHHNATSKSWAPILWRYPHILRSCAVNYFGEWPPDALVTVAQKCLAQSLPTTNEISTQTAAAVVEVYKATRGYLSTCTQSTLGEGQHEVQNVNFAGVAKSNISRIWEGRSTSFIQVDSSMLVDHLDLLAKHYEQLQSAVSTNLSRFTTGLKFIDQTAHTLQIEQTQAELLLPEVQQKAEHRRRMSGSLEREKNATDKVTRGLELATTLAATQRERVISVTQEYDDLIKESRVSFMKMRATLRLFREAVESEDVHGVNEGGEQGDNEDKKIGQEVLSVEDTDSTHDELNVDAAMIARRRQRKLIQNFVSLDRIPSSIYQLSECLGVILGIQSVEGRDDMDPEEVIMNYWENVAVGLQTPAFWQTLMTFDVSTRVTEKMVGSLLPICTSPDFDKSLFASVHVVAGVLCEWVQKCMAFAQDFILAGPKFVQLQHEQILLKQAEEHINISEMEIYAQATSLQHTHELRDLSELERLRADERLQDTTSLLHLTTAAWTELSTTREKWKQLYDSYFEFSAHWKGDLILGTAVIAYASCLNQLARLKLHGLWTEAIKAHSLIPSPSRRTLQDIFHVRHTDVSKLILNGLPLHDESALENALVALHSYRSPLLIDPYGVAMNWLKKHNKSSKLRVVSGSRSTTDSTLWNEIETGIKQEATLIIADICRERMHGLHSFIGAKRRALFDAINRDVNASRGNSEGYRCWCNPPDEGAEFYDPGCGHQFYVNPKVSLSFHVTAPIFEFGSNTCKIYFVYTESNDIPCWMSAYLSQLAVVRFDLSAPFVEVQALQKLLESQGRLRELTEVRTLQHEMVICDEQIDGLENELLDFFSTEKAEQLYSDNAKILRIVANRSSVITLQNTKAEAMLKVQTHWDSFVSYVAVAKRCLDVVWAWHEFNLLACNGDTGDDTIALSWVWRLLIRAGEASNKSDLHLEDVMACFTSSIQQYVVMNLRDEDRLLFQFLLATRIWERRMEEEMRTSEPSLSVKNHDLNVTLESSSQSRHLVEFGLFVRLLALIRCRTDRNTPDTCRPSSKSLLALRPVGMKATTWSSVCFLAEGSVALRHFISRMENTGDGQNAWKALIELGSNSSNDWKVPTPLDSFTRLCLVTAVHPYRFLYELEEFSTQELQRVNSLYVASRNDSLSSVRMNTTALHTVVTAAAYSAHSQAPSRHRDLFHLWRSFSSAKAPLIIICPPGIDFVDAVVSVAKKAGATMDVSDTIQLLHVDDTVFRNMVFLAMSNGHWVVLPNLHTFPGRLAQLNKIYESLEDGEAHSDFRLWISISNKALSSREPTLMDFEISRLNRIATQIKWGTGFLSLKRCLHHSFAILKHELDAFTFSSTIAVLPALVSTNALVLNEYEEMHVKQLGVFHALVSSCDHFPFAQWKTNEEFGDIELCSAIRSLIVLKKEAETVVKEHPSPLRAEGSGVWSATTLRGVIVNVYSSKVTGHQDELLIDCCLDFVLNAWPTEQEEMLHGVTSDAARLAIPEVIFAIEKLAVVPWLSILNAIPQFWPSECCGPFVKDPLATNGLQSLETMSLWDPQHLRRDRYQKITAQLAAWTANRGLCVSKSLLPSLPQQKTEILPLLETLAAFIKSLDASTLQSQVGDFDYRKPLMALMLHEQQALEQIRKSILKDAKQLEMVSLRGLTLDPSIQQQYEELRDNRIPITWLELLRLAPCNDTNAQNWGLERFQRLLLGRINTFSSWSEPEEGLYKLSLDKFRESEYVFEAVHQHFVRNHVGAAFCAPNCLRVVSLFEDSPRLVLPPKKGVVYFTGLRVMGHLQLQVLDFKSQRRRFPPSPEGIPVVLQVSSACLSETPENSTGSRKFSVVPTQKTHDIEKTRQTLRHEEHSDTKGTTKFLCPLFRESGGSSKSKRAEISIYVMSTMPVEQLVFSGSSLHFQSLG